MLGLRLGVALSKPATAETGPSVAVRPRSLRSSASVAALSITSASGLQPAGIVSQSSVAEVDLALISAGATYYVSTTGSDATGDGSEGNPWASISHAAGEIEGGDTIVVEDGVYTGINQQSLPSGTPGNPTTVRARNKHGAVLNHGNYATFRLYAGAYIVIDGFYMDLETGGGGVNSEGGHHVTMINCKVTGGSYHAFAGHSGDFYVVEDNEVSGQRFSDWWSAISFYQMLNVTGSSETGFRNKIRNNVIFDCYTVGGSLTDGNGIIIDDGHNGQRDSEHPDFGINYAFETLVEGNLVVACGGKGIQSYVTDHVTVRNNTAAFNGNPGQEHNNTDWWAEISCSVCADCTFVDNIAITDPSLHGGKQRCFADTGLDASNADTVWLNNCGWEIDGGYSVWLNGLGEGPLIGANPLLGTDPEVVNATTDIATADYHLDTGSPCIGAGVSGGDLGAYGVPGDPGEPEPDPETYSVFADQTPTTRETADPDGYTLGTKFKVSVAGSAIALRYYRHADDTGNRTVRLFEAGNTTPLASVDTVDPGGTGGWVEVAITPVALTPGVTYIVAVTRLAATQGYYVSSGFFATEHANGPLTAVSNIDGGNGVFLPAATGELPTNTFNASFYWTDMVFDPA